MNCDPPTKTRDIIMIPRHLARNWFYLAIVCAFSVGWGVPVLGEWMKALGVTPYLVAVAFFFNGFTLSTDSLLGSLREWRILLINALLIFIISPALMWGVRALLPGGNSLLGQGFQLVALVPTMLVSAVVLTRTAKGDGAVALYLTVFANLLAILLVPPLLLLTLGSFGARLNIAETSLNLLITVLVPTILGQAARNRFPKWAHAHAGQISTLSMCTILLFIITGLSALPHGHLSVGIWLLVIGGVLLLHLALLAIGRLAGRAWRVPEPACRALTFCSSQKSMVFVILLWERLYAHRGAAYGIVVLPGILYYVMELITDSVLAQWWGHRQGRRAKQL
jgi:predicted Na+-dependent transporter